jgi:hypothetical protein
VASYAANVAYSANAVAVMDKKKALETNVASVRAFSSTSPGLVAENRNQSKGSPV